MLMLLRIWNFCWLVFLCIQISSCVMVIDRQHTQEVQYNNYFTAFTLPPGINSPDTMNVWLQKNFSYIDKNHAAWKMPWETIQDHGGDCKHFAVLTSLMLSKMGYKTSIVGIMYKDKDGSDTGHAICLFQQRDGKWSLFSNQYYDSDEYDSIKDIVISNFPKWTEIHFYEPNGKIVGTWHAKTK